MYFWSNQQASSGSGVSYVSRGNVLTWDWQLANFTCDGTVKTFNMSSIVPATAKLVTVRLYVKCSTVNHWFGFGAVGATTPYALVGVSAMTAGTWGDAQVTIPITAAGLVAYEGTNRVNGIGVSVLGWWL